MNCYKNMTKRICLVFLRDHAAVFFSVLSMLVTLILMGIFLENVNVENITDLLNQYGGIRNTSLDQENAKHLIQYWTLAGILIVNSVTVTLSVIGVMVNDIANNKIQSFYTAPVSDKMIAFSYVSAAVIIGSVFCFLTFLLGQIYICAMGGTLLKLSQILKILVYILMNVCIFSVMMYLVALYVQSNNAWSGIATIVGTLVGFAGGVYLPIGALPTSVGNVLKYEPVLYGASLMRKVLCEDILQKTFAGTQDTLLQTYREHMGIDLVWKEHVLSDATQITFLLGFGFLILILINVVVKHKVIKDR